MPRPDLWTCRACGRQFANRNQPHSCGRFTVAAFLAPHGPIERDLFHQFACLVLACGEVSLAPARTRVGFQARMIFASVNRLLPGELHAHVVLHRRLESRRFWRVESLAPRSHVHHFKIRSRQELDGELAGWLREAYEVGEQRWKATGTRVSPSRRR